MPHTLRIRGSLLLVLIQFQFQSHHSSSWGGRLFEFDFGHLFEAGRLLTFSAFRTGAYSRWALIRGWALIRINTVYNFILFAHDSCRYSQSE